jgi:hypothetical protein
MIEADADYVQWAHQAAKLNSLPNTTIIHGLADASNVLPLLEKYPFIDIIDFDIQEAEGTLVPALFPAATNNVLTLKIGIHSNPIYDKLVEFMKGQTDWVMVGEGTRYGIYTECEAALLSRDFDKVPQWCLKRSLFGPLYVRDGEIVYHNIKLLEKLGL